MMNGSIAVFLIYDTVSSCVPHICDCAVSSWHRNPISMTMAGLVLEFKSPSPEHSNVSGTCTSSVSDVNRLGWRRIVSVSLFLCFSLLLIV